MVAFSIEGSPNFRDIGGYKTRTGRSVRQGRVFRSGSLHQLLDRDKERIAQLGVEVVIDLRTESERLAEKSLWLGAPPRTVSFEPADTGNLNAFAEALRRPELTELEVTRLMHDLYKELLVAQAPAFTKMFRMLADGEVPLLLHCTAGKDRTGVGIALLLTALGVPEEIVLRDYALSDQLMNYSAHWKLDEPEQDEIQSYSALRSLPADVVAPILRSDPAYLQAALDLAVQECGSVGAYIEKYYSVSELDLISLKRNLLED